MFKVESCPGQGLIEARVSRTETASTVPELVRKDAIALSMGLDMPDRALTRGAVKKIDWSKQHLAAGLARLQARNLPACSIF